jgi:hypothetical protein
LARIVSALFVCALLLSACSTQVTQTGKQGIFTVKMKIEKGELRKGKNLVELRVTGPDGKPVEGASINVSPWMPEMGHGVPWTVRVHDKGGGVYRTNLLLSMGGLWEIRLDIKAGGKSDRVVFVFPNVKE